MGKLYCNGLFFQPRTEEKYNKTAVFCHCAPEKTPLYYFSNPKCEET